MLLFVSIDFSRISSIEFGDFGIIGLNAIIKIIKKFVFSSLDTSRIFVIYNLLLLVKPAHNRGMQATYD